MSTYITYESLGLFVYFLDLYQLYTLRDQEFVDFKTNEIANIRF